MTEKLFENDAYLWECEAVVNACELCKNGFAVELDKTVFFPEGGGQLSDRGKLGEAAVTHVAEEDGRILHFCDKPLAVGSTVKAVVDGVVRLDHSSSTAANIFCLTRRGSCLAQTISAFI